jgi:hypothetical protein
MTAAFDPFDKKERKLNKMATIEALIKDISHTTTGASSGKQLVTMIVEIDDTVDVDSDLVKNQATGIEIPSHAPHG